MISCGTMTPTSSSDSNTVLHFTIILLCTLLVHTCIVAAHTMITVFMSDMLICCVAWSMYTQHVINECNHVIMNDCFIKPMLYMYTQCIVRIGNLIASSGGSNSSSEELIEALCTHQLYTFNASWLASHNCYYCVYNKLVVISTLKEFG